MTQPNSNFPNHGATFTYDLTDVLYRLLQSTEKGKEIIDSASSGSLDINDFLLEQPLSQSSANGSTIIGETSNQIHAEPTDPSLKTIMSEVNSKESNVANTRGSCTKTSEEINSSQLSALPSERAASNCSGYVILREIVHAKGQTEMRLQIHARLIDEKCYLAILDAKHSNEHHTVELPNESHNEVEQYLRKYLRAREEEGYTRKDDVIPLPFLRALLTGFGQDEGLSRGMPANSNRKTKTAFSLKEKRNRVEGISFGDLSKHFHLPRDVAAEKLGICPTSVHNKYCSYVGSEARWPFRKIQPLLKEISHWQDQLSKNPKDKEEYEDKIRQLNNKRKQYLMELKMLASNNEATVTKKRVPSGPGECSKS